MPIGACGRATKGGDVVAKLRGHVRTLGTATLAVALALVAMAVVPPAATGVGPCDAPVNAIVAENCLTGAPASQWDVNGAGDPDLQGFATQFSVDHGETVHFKIDTAATAYRLDIYRIGWYGGDGARLVATRTPSAAPPQPQPACLTVAATGLIDCGNWSESASWPVPANAVSGVYFAKLVRTDGPVGASHIPFVVRDDDGTADLLFQTSDTTWQAYNDYGGNSLYTGSPDARAYKVSYNRPLVVRENIPEDAFFNAEYPMVRWLEANGYDTAYVSGADTDRAGAELLEHNVFMSVGHDEYWSGAQRANVEAARDAGVHLAFFSGNEVFWKTRWEDSIDGTNSSHRTLVSYKETHNNAKIDPSAEWTGTWRDKRFSPPADGGRPENALTGTIFTVNCCTYNMQVPSAEGQLRFWRNTPVAALEGTTATLADGTLGYEWDEDLDNGARPAGLINLSSTTVNVPQRIQDNGSNYAPGTATHSLTLYRKGSALVFGAGTVQWSWGLDGTHDGNAHTPDPSIRQATVNLFADMGVQPATLEAGLTAATASTDTTAPSATITSPDPGDTVPANTQVTVTGTAADAGGGKVGGIEVSTDDGTTWHEAQGRENWSYTFTPTTVGTATLRSRATDDSANRGAASSGVALDVAPAGCPCSIWSNASTPATVGNHDPGHDAISLGVRFRSDVDGEITGFRFYKSPGETGTHTAHLWTNGGTLLGTATFTGEGASGWQQATLATPVSITADTTYVASYFSPTGVYSFTGGYFGGATDSPPLHALASNAGALNGVYHYDEDAFPTDSFNATNYWVDVVFSNGADETPPLISERTPGPGATNVAATASVTVRFNEAMDPATINGTTLRLRNAANDIVPATVSYDNNTLTATLDPSAGLTPGATYTASVTGGAAGVKDANGNALATNPSWSFTIAPPPADSGPGGPILVIGSTANPFSRYYGEILSAEGLNEYLVKDISTVTAAVLADYDAVILGEMPLTTAQVFMLAAYAVDGGNLVAMHPGPNLLGLLGLTGAAGTLSDAYMRVDTSTPPGLGISGETLQFHGSANRYTLSGASAIATLYSNASTATANPAVTVNNVGSNGGQAAAFTYDLARSVVYSRQGNPAWAGQERDGQPPIRSDDLFFGAAAGDPQPDWIDLSKVAIPQADEQQRLLANLVQHITSDRTPLPRFWYFPRDEEAVVVMTGDDHGSGGTEDRFDAEQVASPAGCSVADWECVRSTSYVYTAVPLTDAEADSYDTAGFEIALHVNTNCSDWTPASLASDYSSQLGAWTAKYTSIPAPSTNRTHCITWSDYASQPKVELTKGIRLDTNYYYWPESWVADRPGMFTGSGMPMRFADTDGSVIDVYQATTQMTDESGQEYPATINALLDNAQGPLGYYGAFTANMHTDNGAHAGWSAIVDSAQDRDVPIVTARQMLTWLDGRNGSSFANLAWNSNVLDFTIDAAPGAQGLRAMVPQTVAGGATLETLTRDGAPVTFTTKTIKGVTYAFFNGTDGDYEATYATDTTAPEITDVSATAGAGGTATVTWTTDEPADSAVAYGANPNNLSGTATDAAPVTSHSVQLTGLVPGLTYYFRVTSTDAAGNDATAPAPPSEPASFVVPSFVGTDTTVADFDAGAAGACRVVAHSGDGEVTLGAAVASEFSGSALPSGWEAVPWAGGGGATVNGGQVAVNGARLNTTTFFGPGRVLEFVATFAAEGNQHIGFSDDLNNAPWAIFSTGSDGSSLRARTHNGSTESNDVIPGNWLGTPHRYRIEWGATQVRYLIDGDVVATHSNAPSANLRPIASDLFTTGGNIAIDWLQLSPFSTPCTFTSRTFDANEHATWLSLDPTASTPAGTTVNFETRTSSDATNWSTWVAVSGTTITSPDGRYLQYRAELATTDTGEAPALASVTVSAQVAPPEITVAPGSVTEGNSGTTTLSVPVSLNRPSASEVTVDWATANFTATSPSDYAATSGTVTFAPGDTSETIDISVVADTLYENNDFLLVALSNPTNATIGANGIGTGKIVNDDAQPSLAIADTSIAEGNTGTKVMTFTVSLSQASGVTTTVKFATANGTAAAGSDYTATNGTLTFTAGQTSKTVSVTVSGDALYEANETLRVNLTAPVNATITDAQATGTITNDDTKPTIAIADAAKAEGNSGTSNLVFTITQSKVTGTPSTVAWSTANSTAAAPGDYTAASGTATIPAGQTTTTVAVPIKGDTLYEANETLRVNLATPVDATISDAQATGTITNDDTKPTVVIADRTKAEGTGASTPFVFTITQSKITGAATTVQWASANGTAKSGTDYAAASGTATIAAGQTTTTVTVNVTGDATAEPSETFFVNITVPVNATIADGQAKATITNDD